MATHFAAHPEATEGPPVEAMAAARALVDYRRIELGPKRITLQPGMALTLNGIAQGYITDRVTDYLRNEGFDNGIAAPACTPEAISVGGVYDEDVGSTSWCGPQGCPSILCTDNPTAADLFVCHTNSDELLDILAPQWRARVAKMAACRLVGSVSPLSTNCAVSAIARTIGGCSTSRMTYQGAERHSRC
jgi:hypothetical protein